MVFCEDELVFQNHGNGIAPLIEAIDTLGRENLLGVITADRIVGKAAALLNLYMGVTEVHAGVISSGTKKLLSRHGARAPASIARVEGIIIKPPLTSHP